MQVTLAQCSQRHMGEKLLKHQVFLSGVNSSERVLRTCKMMKEVVVQNFTEPMKMLSVESCACR